MTFGPNEVALNVTVSLYESMKVCTFMWIVFCENRMHYLGKKSLIKLIYLIKASGYAEYEILIVYLFKSRDSAWQCPCPDPQQCILNN